MASIKAELDNTLHTPKFSANTSFESFHSSLIAKSSNISQKTETSIWCHEYSTDILASLKDSEKRRRCVDYKSRQLSHRSMLLMLMKIAADRMPLNRTTLHLAVYLLDCFMDTYTIAVDKLNASALMCLLIAAKIEEADLNIPKFPELNQLVGDIYTIQEFKVVEKKILSTFHFDIIHPTAATFVESYSNQLVSYQDFLCYQINRSSTYLSVFSSYESMVQETTEVLFSVLDISLNENRLVNYTPSVVGAACLAATRSIKKIQPVWTERLIELTGYNFETIEPFVDALKALYSRYAKKEENICDSPDSGIASNSQSESESEEEQEEEEEEEDVIEYHPAMKRRRIFD